MKLTKCTGGTCIGDLRLCPIDVGFDLRLHDYEVLVPEDAKSAGFDRDGESWLVEGTHAEIVRELKRAGYKIAKSAE
jgi:hypothetical protein